MNDRRQGMLISSESAEALELPSLLAMVAECAACDAGREKLRALEPWSSTAEIGERLERGREVERLLEDGVLVEARDEPFLPLFEKLAAGRVAIDGSELVELRNLLRATGLAGRRIAGAEPACPQLVTISSGLPDLSDLATRLEKALDDRGRVRDEASPRLAKLRRQSQRVRQSTYRKLETFVRKHSQELAEETVPVHEERLVVLLRSGSKGRLQGLVHGRSGSGQSFYFEPLEVVEANNELRTAQTEEEAERRRILRELVERTYAELDSLEAHLSFLTELDVRQAIVRWSKLCEGVWVEPRAEQPYALVEARHPLIDPRLAGLRERALGQSGHRDDVEPLSVELGEQARLLVITGPNAGGKTVALKTLGLLALAVHCGLPVPVRPGTTMPLLERLVASVGDEQDLLADRSTFSGRLLRLKEAWDMAGPRTLILLDELGSGTDPEEGAALGVALMEELVEKRALAALSSHLTRLAAAALDLEGAACAAMAFDVESGSPTFQLVPGTPGGSEALSLAQRLGLPAAWTDRARDLLGPDHGRLQQLLAEVESVRTELGGQLAKVASENSALEAERRALETARGDLEAARDGASEEARREIGDLRDKIRRRLRKEVDRLKKEVEGGRRRGLARESLERVFRDAPEVEPKRSGLPIEIGSRVRHRGLGWEGSVKRLERGRAEVVVGDKRIVSRLEELDGLQGKPATPRGKREGVSVSARASDQMPAKELHLRGERVEDALEALDRYLDQALLAGMPEVRVVHGHGTGRLKKAVRDSLDRHPAVAKWRPGGRGEGGEGATVADLGG